MRFFLCMSVLLASFSLFARPVKVQIPLDQNLTMPLGLYFLGDSVTEGAAYYSDNEAIQDSWLSILECDGPEVLDGRCSNAAPGALYPNADNVRKIPAAYRTIAYPYKVQDALSSLGFNVDVKNIAVSGARPATWDPSAEGLEMAHARCAQWDSLEECSLNFHESCQWIAHSSCVPAYGNDVPDNQTCAAHKVEDSCASEQEIKCIWHEENSCVSKRGYVGQFLFKNQRWSPSFKPEYKAALEKMGRYNAPLETLIVQEGILDIPKDYVSIVTLGANPILSRWLNPKFGFLGFKIFERPDNGSLGYNIAQNPLNCSQSAKAANQCMHEDMDYFKTVDHLKNVYRELISKNDVLVLLYYHACSGFSQQKYFVLKPGKTWPCSQNLKSIFAGAEDILNLGIARAVCEVKKEMGEDHAYQIDYVCPGYGFADDKSVQMSCADLEKNNFTSGLECSYFDEHQYSMGSEKQWVSSSDAGVHPNEMGHAVLGQTIINALCDKFGYYCKK